MGILNGLRKRLSYRETTLTECRQCGTKCSEDTTECPVCGSKEIVTYNF